MEKERFFVNVSGANWQCSPAMEMQLAHLPSFMNLNCGSSMEQGANQFDSAYSSIVSSPAASTVVNTPACSPPKLNLAMVEQQIVGRRSHPTPANSLLPFPTDPGFAERAAKNSCFGNQSLGGAMELPYISACSMAEDGNGREESSVSDQVITEVHGRKRKAAPEGKAKGRVKASQDVDANLKRSKAQETEKVAAGKKAEQGKDKAKPPEPLKDYIHVRARRGQATDSHSLAERVRREKIRERMKLLQDLVPGCNKVTGNSVVLDEIINYVQSLQRQVEFLSMKLATVNPRLDFNMEALLSKDMHHHDNSAPQNGGFPLNSTTAPETVAFSFAHHPSSGPAIQNLGANPSIDAFGDVAAQFAGIGEDEFQTVMQMGFGQNQDLVFQSQNFHGTLPTAHMKVEL